MGGSVTLTGPGGRRHMTKLANQIIVACNITGWRSPGAGHKAGLDPEVVFNAIKGGWPAHGFERQSAMAIARNFKRASGSPA